MSINKEQTDLINNYFDGQISASEKINLEGQLSKDPLLKSEFEHQQEIVKGLQDFRRAQLKTRLEAIVINPGILGFISQSTAFKSLSYMAAGILVGTGIYFYATQEEARVTNIDQVDPYLDYALTGTDEIAVEIPLAYRYPVKANEQLTWIEPAIAEVQVDVVDKFETQPPVRSKHTFEVPQVDASSDDDSGLLGDEMEAIAPARLDDLSDVGSLNKMEIENIITNKYKFHYKLENGRLYLYGKFDISPYHILELNNKSDKKLFFQYNGNYFRLKENTRDITPLEKIEDSSILDELEIIKSK